MWYEESTPWVLGPLTLVRCIGIAWQSLIGWHVSLLEGCHLCSLSTIRLFVQMNLPMKFKLSWVMLGRQIKGSKITYVAWHNGDCMLILVYSNHYMDLILMKAIHHMKEIVKLTTKMHHIITWLVKIWLFIAQGTIFCVRTNQQDQPNELNNLANAYVCIFVVISTNVWSL